MRAAAVGWLASTETEVLDLAAAQAAVSHDHPDAIAAAQAVALTIFLLRENVAPRAVRGRLIDEFSYDLSPERAFSRGGFDMSAAGTVPPAFTAAFECPDWESAVRTVVCLGGDADTLACIAGAVAEALHGLPDDIAKRARAHLTDDLRRVVVRFEESVARLRYAERHGRWSPEGV
jgi:ADP-ribosylglycohydrolase